LAERKKRNEALRSEGRGVDKAYGARSGEGECFHCENEDGTGGRLKGKLIPTRNECLSLMNQSEMLGNIFDHSLQVSRVALYLAIELNKRGQNIDLHLVEAASLLHDVTKTECLKTKEDHAQTASQVLKGMGYIRVGEIVAEHVHLARQIDPSRVTEEEIVNYADKRVCHHRIVSLEERFCDLMDRYAKNERAVEQMEQLKKVTVEIQKKIFSILEIDPGDILHLQVDKELSMGDLINE
jgi:uncharacterized protein